MSTVTYKDKAKTRSSWEMTLVATSLASAQASPASAIIAASLFNEQYDINNQQVTELPKGPSVWKQIVDFIQEYRRYRRLVKKAGKDLRIPFYRVSDIEEEVQRHRWIEAEKAGRDIWTEKDPADPDGVALRDWISSHFENWKQSRISKHRLA